MNNFESNVYKWCHDNNIDVEWSIIMGYGENSYQYDFKVKNKKILIECQGTYWHGDPRFFNDSGTDGKKILNETQKKIIKKDKKKKEFALNHGFKIMYLWEHDFNNADYKILYDLKEIL